MSLIDGKKFTVDETPLVNHNINIIGLMALNYLGFLIKNGDFELELLPEYL